MFCTSWRSIIERVAEEVKYSRAAFTNESRQDKKLNVSLGKTNIVMRALHHLVVLKRGLLTNIKFLQFTLILVPTLTCGPKSWLTNGDEKKKTFVFF